MLRILLVAIYLAFSIAGLSLIKIGGNAGAFGTVKGVLHFEISWISLLGMICYLCSFLLYTRIVVMFDLSYITPIITGIVQILILLVSFVLFKEKVTWQAIAGASMVIIGITVMNIGKQ